MDALREAEITLYIDSSGKENNEGKPYVDVLPYVKVRTQDSTGNWQGSEYYMPLKMSLQTQAHYDQPYRVVIERRSSGATPPKANEQVAEFHNV